MTVIALSVALALCWVHASVAAERPDWYPSDDVVKAQVASRDARREAEIAYYQRELGGYPTASGGNPDADTLRIMAANGLAEMLAKDPFGYYLYAVGMVGTSAPPQTVRRAVSASCNLVRKSCIRFHAMARYAIVKGVPE